MIEIVRVAFAQSLLNCLKHKTTGCALQAGAHHVTEKPSPRGARVRGVMQPGKAERLAAATENFSACFERDGVNFLFQLAWIKHRIPMPATRRHGGAAVSCLFCK